METTMFEIESLRMELTADQTLQKKRLVNLKTHQYKLLKMNYYTGYYDWENINSEQLENFKWSNINVTEVPKGEVRGQGEEKTLEVTMAKNFSKFD